MSGDIRKYMAVTFTATMVIFLAVMVFMNKKISDEIKSSYAINGTTDVKEKVFVQDCPKPVAINNDFDPLAPAKKTLVDRSGKEFFPKEKNRTIYKTPERSSVFVQ